MAQRVIKIILPENLGGEALELLEGQEGLRFWQEESSGGNFVASALTESGLSETVMDTFERRFSHVEGFQLILFPVEASLPRENKEEGKKAASGPSAKEAEKGKPSRISREELYSDVAEGAELSNIFVLMAILSTVVVAIGLLKNNVAVIIGAMVIAPFLGPNVALALSTNLADNKLGINAMKTLSAGIGIVLVLSAAMGYIFEADPAIPEIDSRTRADLADMILALASGCAGVLAFTTGAFSTVIGVMVAVALLPPLTVGGLLTGAGHLADAGGAFLLFITNIICINLAGVVTFRLQGVSPRIWWEADKAKRAARKATMWWSAILIALAGLIFILGRGW